MSYPWDQIFNGFSLERQHLQGAATFPVMGHATVFGSRIAFYLYNISFFPDMTAGRLMTILLGGLHFDLTAVLYTNVLFIVLMILPFKFRFHRGLPGHCPLGVLPLQRYCTGF
jgi:hypothetical protein